MTARDEGSTSRLLLASHDKEKRRPAKSLGFGGVAKNFLDVAN